MTEQTPRPTVKEHEYTVLQAPHEEGGTVYRIPPDEMETIDRLEAEFSPRVGVSLFFADRRKGLLTPFAVRLFKKGYISIQENDLGSRVQTVTAIQPEIERRLRKIMDDAFPEAEQVSEEEIVIPEADLPFEGALGARPAGMHGLGHRRPIFGARHDENPVDILENILYGRTAKDDPEGSHHGEHEISNGVDHD